MQAAWYMASSDTRIKGRTGRIGDYFHRAAQRLAPPPHPAPPSSDWLISDWLESVATRQARATVSFENEFRAFAAPLSDVFHVAVKDNPNISISNDVMGGAPCIINTRIPVYLVLESLEEYGTIQDVQSAYPRLSEDDIKAALRFSKTVVECPVDYETRSATR
jgi:uncharacterized protein (DUF433 family)